MRTTPIKIQGQSGLSIVEIMVGMVIALISTIIVLQVFATFEGQKRTTSSGSDAQTNGSISLYTIERAVRMAGYGLAEATGCTVTTALSTKINRTSLGTSFVIRPVTIVNGASGVADTVQVLGSNKTGWSVAARNITVHAQTDTNFNTNASVGMSSGDFLVIYEPGQPADCALMQITSANPVINPVQHTATAVAPSTLVWNDTATLRAAGYSDKALLLNLGSILYTTYSLDANSNLVISDYNSGTNTFTSQNASPDIVNLQAQYGFDTRGGVQTTSIMDTWSSTMIDADGDGVTGDEDDIRRIYAVRLAIVSRSNLKEKPDPTTGLCATTTNANPAWAGSGLTGGGIDLTKNPDGTANADWGCYRYKTFETIVPLRNQLSR